MTLLPGVRLTTTWLVSVTIFAGSSLCHTLQKPSGLLAEVTHNIPSAAPIITNSVMPNIREGFTIASTSTTEEGRGSDRGETEPWSLVWYIGSFSALVLFFLIVSCSECCCTKVPSTAARNMQPLESVVDDGPSPPPYDLFAPPAYDSLNYATSDGTKSKMAIFVIPESQNPSPPP